MSNKNRKPIDMAALASIALPQPDPVAAAVQAPKHMPELPPTTGWRQPSRIGKVGIQFWTDPETRKKLKLYATETDRTLDELVAEALSDFMRKKAIA